MTRIIERKTTARETSLPLWPRLQPWTTTTKGGTKEFRDANVKQLSHRVAFAWAFAFKVCLFVQLFVGWLVLSKGRPWGWWRAFTGDATWRFVRGM